jgi:PAS domain S-box-containing protein
MRPLNILILEDVPADAELMQRELKKAKLAFTARRVDTREGFCQGLQESPPDLILADYRLPSFDGIAALAIARQVCPKVPFIFVSGSIGEERAIENLKTGATDYVLKERLGRLAPAVKRALQEAETDKKRRRAEEALRESEERFASFMQHLPGVASILDLQGKYAYVNKAWESIFQKNREDWYGKSLDDVLPGPIAQQFKEDCQAVIATGQVSQVIRALEHPDGTHYWLMNRFPILDKDGQPTLVGSMGIDITERKEAEARAERHLQSFDLLLAGVEKLARIRDPDAMIQEICQLVVDAFGARLVWLGQVETDGRVRPLWWAGEAAAFLKETEIRWEPHGQTLQPDMTVELEDLAEGATPTPGFDPLRAGGFRTSATFPLISDHRTFGVLKVLSDRPDFFPSERLELLQAYAGIAAAALENARLNAKAERRLLQLGALRLIDIAITASLDPRVTLNVLLDQVTGQLGVDAAAVLLPIPYLQMLEYTAVRGFRSHAITRTHIRLDECFAGAAALERRLIHIPDLNASGEGLRAPLLLKEGFVTCFALPLLAKGQVKGVLAIFHRAPFNADGEWLEFLEALAGQAAVAIDNAALFDGLQKSHAELELAYEATLEGWAKALELRHDETVGHSQRVVALTLRLARALGLEEQELRHIRRGALLHDIGKIGIPDRILLKPGPLDEEEWRIMRLHPVYAYELLSPISYLRPALDIPYCHHEKWDGSGYPRRLEGEAIPLAARIFAVVDVWEALGSDRPYRRAWPKKKITTYLREQAGRHFDPKVVEVFLTKIIAGED